ncbi:MAG: SCO family protein [Bacteroidia bacterium]
MKSSFWIFIMGCFAISCNEGTQKIQKNDTLEKLPYYNASDFTPVWEIPANSQFHTIRSFCLTDQTGKSFTEKDIDGKICLVDFFFTSCPGICPKMTTNMLELQTLLAADTNVLLLSHSVTPESDSVPVLAEYGKAKGVDYSRWKLLTGNKSEIYNLGRKYYFVEEDLGENRDTSVFLHTENFILIDKNRMIRGIYNGLDKSSITAIKEDIAVLEKE